MDEDGVKGDDSVSEECGDFAEEHGDIVGPSFVDGLSDVASHEERRDFEAFSHFWSSVRGRCFGVELDDFHVSKLGGPCCQGSDKASRRSGHTVQVDLVAAFYGLDGL